MFNDGRPAALASAGEGVDRRHGEVAGHGDGQPSLTEQRLADPRGRRTAENSEGHYISNSEISRPLLWFVRPPPISLEGNMFLRTNPKIPSLWKYGLGPKALYFFF